ncbi:MAG: hypothetical protein M3Y70_02835 [Pseudomonadota bacterium]|nr:hypothetical protein [Pseudomonadota bacterium]
MRLPTAWLLAASVVASMPAMAQEIAAPKRSVRTGYAQVLRVEPIYQTLTATRMEQRCDGEVVPPPDRPRGLARIVDKVKDALGSEAAPPEPTPPLPPNCEMVPVKQTYRRPIAYDVDYVYRGLKYRSRLPYDPGNRLRVQVSIQPYVSP